MPKGYPSGQTTHKYNQSKKGQAMNLFEQKARAERWIPYGEGTIKQQRNVMSIAMREFLCVEQDIEEQGLFVHLNEHTSPISIRAGIMGWEDLCTKLGIFVNTKPVFYWILIENNAFLFLLVESVLDLVAQGKSLTELNDALPAIVKEREIADYEVQEIKGVEL